MAVICPTVLAETTQSYHDQMERLVSFASCLHIDSSDGVFTSQPTVEVDKLWWPKDIQVHVHLMHRHPIKSLEQIINLQPKLVIMHAEATDDPLEFAALLHQSSAQAGVAILPDTPVSKIKHLLPHIDHVLIFSGKLGHFGGQASLSLLNKVTELKALRPELGIGWDGGVDPGNVAALLRGGVDILNVGHYLHDSKNPRAAYARLEEIVLREEHGNTKTPNRRA